MIDLHLHTTASDGLLTPDDLVVRASGAGLTVLGITDHDTIGGLAAAELACLGAGVRLVPGIEITAVEAAGDVHVLGYFIDSGSVALTSLLDYQRRDRIRRLEEMGRVLGTLGLQIGIEDLVARAAEAGASLGRPAVADALVRRGYAVDRTDAFARWLGRGCPAFVPRQGRRVREVVHAIHAAGGVASLAHPGLLAIDAEIPRLVADGLDAIEVWHSDHSPADTARYDAIATRHQLARTGGSDYHGEGVHHSSRIGGVVMPAEAFADLERRATTP